MSKRSRRLFSSLSFFNVDKTVCVESGGVTVTSNRLVIDDEGVIALLYDSPINCHRLLGEWPNTYTFTKAVAESIVKKGAGDLPVGIFRPAIG